MTGDVTVSVAHEKNPKIEENPKEIQDVIVYDDDGPGQEDWVQNKMPDEQDQSDYLLLDWSFLVGIHRKKGFRFVRILIAFNLFHNISYI